VQPPEHLHLRPRNHHRLEQLLHLQSDRNLQPADSLPSSQLPAADHQPVCASLKACPKAELQPGKQHSPLRRQHLGLGTLWTIFSPIEGYLSLSDGDKVSIHYYC
jgi:hypothetical protein